MKLKATVGAYSDETATFILYLIHIDITAPVVTDPIYYTITDSQKTEYIPAFTTTLNPPAITGWDLSGFTWSYDLKRDDQAALAGGYFIFFDTTSPPSGYIGGVKIQTSDNNEYANGLDSHGNMVAHGKHPLILTASYSIGLKKDKAVNVEVKPFITEPASPATQYYVIGASPKIEFTLDYSTLIPTGHAVTLNLLQEDNSALPSGITRDISIPNKIKVSIEESTAGNNGEFDLKVVASLGLTTVENVKFKVYLMAVTITAPAAVNINYKVGATASDTGISAFTLTSTPNPPGYWTDPQWQYEFYHTD